MYPEILYAERALLAGAMGYLNKEDATTTILAAIRRILEDQVDLSPAMSARILRGSIGHMRPDERSSSVEALSDRELAVFRLIGEGMKSQDIARKARLEPQDHRYLPRAYPEKLGLRGRSELVRAAVRWVVLRL